MVVKYQSNYFLERVYYCKNMIIINKIKCKILNNAFIVDLGVKL